jgi:hypothetical protein
LHDATAAVGRDPGGIQVAPQFVVHMGKTN